MRLSVELASERVARGAAYLDGVAPQWWRRIDVGTLNLSGCYACVLAQTYGMEYCDAASRAGVRWYWNDESELPVQAQRLGFFALDVARDWEDLQDAWIAEIARRRHPVADDTSALEAERQPAVTNSNSDKRGTTASESPVLATRA